MKLSYCEQLYRDISLLESVKCYYDVDLLRNRASRVHKAISLKNGRDTWIIWGVFQIFNIYYYWLVNIEKGVFSSYTVAMNNKRLNKLKISVVDIPNGWNDALAKSDQILPYVRKAKYLHYTTATNYDGYERTNGKWLTVTRHQHPDLQKSLPLGKLYRAIDIGSFVPVFRSESVLVGLGVRY